MLGAFSLLPNLVKNSSLISDKENPSGLIKPPTLSIIPTILAPSWAK